MFQDEKCNIRTVSVLLFLKFVYIFHSNIYLWKLIHSEVQIL